MKKQTLTYIAIGLGFSILLVLVLGIVFGWFKKGKLKLVEGDGEVDRLSSGAIDMSRYTSIASGVKNGLYGINVSSAHFIAIADQLLALNDNELRVVSNIYLTDYGTKDYPTLRSIIQGEYLGSYIGLPCTQNEKTVIGSACYKQAKVIDRLNDINA